MAPFSRSFMALSYWSRKSAAAAAPMSTRKSPDVGTGSMQNENRNLAATSSSGGYSARSNRAPISKACLLISVEYVPTKT